MKRDLDLIRALLVEFEGLGVNDAVQAVAVSIPGWPGDVIVYHCLLLDDAEFIEAFDASSSSGRNLFVRRLTNAGHAYLEAVRDAGVWEKVKAVAKDKGIDIPFELVKSLALSYIGGKLGIG